MSSRYSSLSLDRYKRFSDCLSAVMMHSSMYFIHCPGSSSQYSKPLPDDNSAMMLSVEYVMIFGFII